MARDRISVRFTEKTKQLFARIARAGKINLIPVLNEVGKSYRREVGLIFGKKQSRDPSLKWAPLTPAYARQKEKDFPGQPILQRTGKLKRSMTVKNSSGNISMVTPASAVFGSEVPYGIFHDEGTVNLPVRNFSEPGDRRRQIFIDQIEDGVIEQFRRNGIFVTKGFVFK